MLTLKTYQQNALDALRTYCRQCVATGDPDVSREKRTLGTLWSERSAGQCLFVMPKGKDFAAIQAKLQ